MDKIKREEQFHLLQSTRNLVLMCLQNYDIEIESDKYKIKLLEVAEGLLRIALREESHREESHDE